jgi:asparaginyl-tRNA synthetase
VISGYLCRSLFSANVLNKRIKVKELLALEPNNQEVTVMGWVRSFRNNQFIALNDGSTNNNIQIVAELGKFDEDYFETYHHLRFIKGIGSHCSSLGKGQKMDLKATTIEILGDSDAEKYPIQLKKQANIGIPERGCSFSFSHKYFRCCISCSSFTGFFGS